MPADYRKRYAEETIPYPDDYEPTEWVSRVVGSYYRATNWGRDDAATSVYLCTGYNPKLGFWMVEMDNEEGTEPNITNVSERAIDATFHRQIIQAQQISDLWDTGDLLRIREWASKIVNTVDGPGFQETHFSDRSVIKVFIDDAGEVTGNTFYAYREVPV